MHAVFALFIDGAIVFILRCQTAARGAQNNTGPVGVLAVKFNPRLGHRLTRRQQRKLRKPVIERNLLAVEVGVFVITAHLPADLNSQPVYVPNIKRTNAATPFAHGLKR